MSGMFVVGIGVNLFVSRFKSAGISLPSVKTNIAKVSLSPVFQRPRTERS